MNHCKVHRNKMIVEYAQLLSSAHHMLDGKNAISGIYRLTHKNHPCAIWVRKTRSNYMWLYDLLDELLDQYHRDTGKVHKTSSVFGRLERFPSNIPDGNFTEPPECMPDEFKSETTSISYKKYLNYKYLDWTTRPKPIKVEFFGKTPNWVSGYQSNLGKRVVRKD